MRTKFIGIWAHRDVVQAKKYEHIVPSTQHDEWCTRIRTEAATAEQREMTEKRVLRWNWRTRRSQNPSWWWILYDLAKRQKHYGGIRGYVCDCVCCARACLCVARSRYITYGRSSGGTSSSCAHQQSILKRERRMRWFKRLWGTVKK